MAESPLNQLINKSLPLLIVNSELNLKKGVGVASTAMASQESTGTKRKLLDNIQSNESAKYTRQSLNEIKRDILTSKSHFVKPNQQHNKPNLNKSTRNLTVTRSNPDLRATDTSQPKEASWELPKNPLRPRPSIGKQGPPLHNSFENLSDPFSQSEAEMTDVNQPTQQKAQTSNNRRIKPPPLIIKNQSIKKMAQLLKDSKIQGDAFTLSEINTEFTSLFPNSMETYEQIKPILEQEKIERFTFTPRNKKLKTRVLKGVKGGYDETDVKNALLEKNLPDVTIHKVMKLPFRAHPGKYHFIVQITYDSPLPNLTKINFLLNQRVHWDKKKEASLYSNVKTVNE